METTKKAFQKVIKEIRAEIDPTISRRNEYPKPMMTKKQMDKDEATVNCGGEWGSAESTKTIADAVLTDKRFEEFLHNFRADASIELNNFNTYQIRVKFR